MSHETAVQCKPAAGRRQSCHAQQRERAGPVSSAGLRDAV